MQVDDRTGPTGADDAPEDPRLLDPPKPLLRLEGRPELAAKIAKLSEGLSAAGVVGPAKASGRAPHPGLITSGSLDEARAYLTGIVPAPEADPITLEIQRVHIADDAIAASWVTERIEKPAQALAERSSAPGVGVPSDTERVDGGRQEPDEAKWSRMRTRARAAVIGVLCVGFAAVGVGYGLLVRQPPSKLFLQRANAAIYVPEEIGNAVDAFVYDAWREQAVRSAMSVAPGALGPIAASSLQSVARNAERGPRVAAPAPWRPQVGAGRLDGSSTKAPAVPATIAEKIIPPELLQ
jgi:hypothetical protein